MSNLYGIADRHELIERIGDIRQLAGFRRMMLMDGKGKGYEVIKSPEQRVPSSFMDLKCISLGFKSLQLRAKRCY